MQRTTLVQGFIGALVLVALASPAFASPATGMGRAVIAKDRDKARATATTGATRNALEQAVKALGGPGDGEDAEIDAAIYNKAATFLVKADVAGETVEGNVLTVKLSVTVDDASLKAALGNKKGKPTASDGPGTDGGGKRVLVLATEQIGPQHVIGWTDVVFTRDALSTKTNMIEVKNDIGGMEAAISEAFTNAGYAVIDPSVLAGKLAPKKTLEVMDLTNAAAVSIANKADADLVVIAKGVAKLAYNSTLAQGEMHSGQANVAARLIRIKDGRVVASDSEHAAAVHIDQDTAMVDAINEASKQAAEALVQKASGSH
jgi:hypothetical protein